MLADTSQRTVKLRSSVDLDATVKRKTPGTHEVYITFRSMCKEKPPTADDYGVTDSEKATKLNRALNHLSAHNEVFFHWLEADVQNAILFANDPVKAIKTAIPDFDETVLTDLTDVFK